MNLLKLEYFVTVAEYQNFTKAAQKFHMAQSAISQQIKSLEQEIGVELIDRSSSHFQLTPAGTALVEDAKKLINEFDFAIEKCRSISSSYRGNLTFGIVGWDENIFLKKILDSFKERYPNIKLYFKRVAFNAIEEDLANKEYDCTLTFAYDLTGKEDIGTIDMFKSPVYALISKKNRLSEKLSVTMEELSKECCLFFQTDNMEKSTQHLMNVFEKLHLKPAKIRYVGDRQIMDIMVGINEGVAIIPEIWSGSPKLEIVKVPIQGLEHYIDFSVVYSRKSENKMLKFFLDIAEKESEIVHKKN